MTDYNRKEVAYALSIGIGLPKLSTLDDLERLIGTLLQKRCVFWSQL